MKRFIAAAIGSSLLALSACASDPQPQTVEVGLVDYAFEGLPTELAAGSTITIDNRSAAELHEFVAVLLPEGEERSAGELLSLPPEEVAAFFPGVRAVLLQPPGSDETIAAEGDGTLTEPGRYLVLCAIPTGADPGEYLAAAAESEGGPPEGVEGGPPHFVNGMVAELLITG